MILWTLRREVRALRQYRLQSRGRADPSRFVEALIELGPTFVKLGQVLSTRPDVLPEEYVAALKRLQERAPMVPLDVIRATIKSELGGKLADHFETFECDPVASASLAQVHRATLRNGSVVAVKVQRSDMDALISRDMAALSLGITILARIAPHKLRRSNLSAFFAEFRRYTLNELDFAAEARTIERFRLNFAGHDTVVIPNTYPKLTTRRVLTIDWVEGLRLGEAAEILTDEKKDILVSSLVNMLLKMFVSDGLFHADLHPGNIVFHSDGRLTLLDFGMYGQLEPRQQDRFVLYWMAVVQGQTRRAFHHFRAQTDALPDADEAAFYSQFAKLAEEFYTSPLRETSLAKVYFEMMQAGYQAGFVFPASLMLHAKALTTAEALLFELAPDARFEQISRPYIAQEFEARVASPNRLAKRASQILPELLLLGELPPQTAMDEDWVWSTTKALANDLALQVGLTKVDGGRAMLRDLVEHYALPILQSTKPALNVSSVLEATWCRYDKLEPNLPVSETTGAMITTHLAAITLAIYESLVAQGQSADEAQSIVYQIGWSIYEPMSVLPLMLAKTLTVDPTKQMRIATGVFRKFPFGEPAYGWRDVDTDPKIVGFDCTKCPVASFFKEHDASDLCVQTWCALDYPLAQKWGGKLERTGTIAMGDDHCDFRWNMGSSRPHQQINRRAKT
ncbi:ubiquinone biosynthesis protein [Litoreibacter halocynthiae]|uniref:Ubiquinone biosynthesis protein n=2 Tax=Litoreibacter halocynthiae TaxID=1242689 RepID=A0A4R7LDR0_9RHOB|nr:ubiquinone biosynthesis protein [Litoreibacter halocynthiae]